MDEKGVKHHEALDQGDDTKQNRGPCPDDFRAGGFAPDSFDSRPMPKGFGKIENPFPDAMFAHVSAMQAPGRQRPMRAADPGDQKEEDV